MVVVGFCNSPAVIFWPISDRQDNTGNVELKEGTELKRRQICLRKDWIGKAWDNHQKLKLESYIRKHLYGKSNRGMIWHSRVENGCWIDFAVWQWNTFLFKMCQHDSAQRKVKIHWKSFISWEVQPWWVRGRPSMIPGKPLIVQDCWNRRKWKRLPAALWPPSAWRKDRAPSRKKGKEQKKSKLHTSWNSRHICWQEVQTHPC